MPFKPGQSGNPRGRPPVGESLATAVRDMGGKDGKKFLAELKRIAFKSKDDRTRLQALQVLIERGYGKPPQTIDMNAGADGEGLMIKVVHEHHA